MRLVLTERLTGWRLRSLAVAALALGAAGASAAPALAAPAWTITMTHANPYGAQASKCPTGKVEPEVPCGIDPFTEAKGDEGEGGNGETFARESGWNSYTIRVENTGTEPTGEVTVSDELPKGFVFGGKPEEMASGKGWTCTTLPFLAKCVREDTPKEGKAYPTITLHVHVRPEAKNPSTNEASVEGGGATSAASTTIAEGQTRVTEAVPFGIDLWNVSVDESLGNPFNQAGGHPFSVRTGIAFNYTTDSHGTLVPAGGPPKEAQGEVPPGFIGNPLVTPRCQFETLIDHQCPASTVVGFTDIVLAGEGEIVNGKGEPTETAGKTITEAFSSLIYNLEPAPGSPAQFGFFAASLPFVLEAKLRSDGDYGVSVGDSAIGDKVLSTRLTFCENGAKVERPEPKVDNLKYSCNEALPGSKPFLSNPTQCPSSTSEKEAARWSLLANPWDEPKDYVSKTAYVNSLEGGAPSEKSFVTGCGSLVFQPELAFKPSAHSEGGTTQADEPTGMSLALNVPQTDEPNVNVTPQLKNLGMKLPAGLTASPSAANGLQACSNSQFGLGTEFGPGSQHSEPAKPASCAPASQIGTFQVFTPLLSGAPAIAGKPEAGRVLTCSEDRPPPHGNWSGNPALSYRWLRSNGKAMEAIANATEREYVVAAADKEKAIQCEVTATNAGGRSVAVSRDDLVSPEPATAPPFPPSSVPAPRGTPSVPNTLSCESGAWTASTGFSYQWLRGGQAIEGKTAPTYTLEPADEGQVIQCQVTGENTAGVTIADSAAVVVSPAPPIPPPLPGAAVQGQVYVGQPECSPCTEEHKDAAEGRVFRLFLEAQDPLRAKDPSAGVIIKLHGAAYANEATGQLETRFEEQPQQPFELLQLKLNGGPRATLANPQTCGPATSSADLTPWSTPATPDAILEPSFEVDSNGAGGPCPAAWPFNPSFNAGTTGRAATTAGAFTNFSLTIGREDREQDLSGVEVHLPLGLVGKIAAVKQCGEAEVHAAERNEGECPAESQIGIATAGAGPGPHPFFQKGKVYLTGPYKGAPFGLAVVTPAVAGPFNLGNIVVRSAIRVDPNTAAVTATADPLPQLKDGVPLRLRKVNVEVNNPNFMLNPTNCTAQQVSAKLTSAQGAIAQVSSPFDVGGCGSLSFSPELTATAGGRGSKANGTSFVVLVKAKAGQANIAKTFLQLPIALPSRLSTIQKACVASVFEANPAACPEGSNIGMATAHTPLLKNPLVGPAYLVSHGNAAFPDVEFVLQGEGITLILDGKTDIKKGITYSRFESVPDAPVSSFEAVLPAGPHSALSAVLPNGSFNVCGTPLLMPTEITGQNGAVVKQTTHIAPTGCPPAAKPTVKITKVKLTGNTLLVTVKTGAAGTVRISGFGLRTTSKHLTAGTHQIRVALTNTGRSMRRHHKKTRVRASLTAGKQAVAKTTAVRL
jgi:Domain of unknown function DUF11